MKLNFEKEKKLLCNCLLQVPVIDDCELLGQKEDGFQVSVQFKDGVEWRLDITVLKRAYPKRIEQLAAALKERTAGTYYLVAAPFVSEESAKLCEKHRLGFLDESGNVRIVFRSLCIMKSGNPNRKPETRDSLNLFNPSAVTASIILRKMLENPARHWKLKYLADEVGCSIGMVSKVKNALCDQMWAEMTKDGVKLLNPESLMEAWSARYKLPEQTMCYTMESVSAFESKLRELNQKHAIRAWLTGFSGGVRYAPVVRYNRVHVFVQPEDVEEFLKFSGCKQVDSGANVVVLPAREDYIYAAGMQNGNYVVSPVQAYLDCMQLKGRGEELAGAILARGI